RRVRGEAGWARGRAEPVVKDDDLGPVGLVCAFGRGVAGGDRSLELVRPWSAQPHRPVEQGARVVNRGAIPEGAVLLLEGDQVASRVEARRPASVMEKEQAQETERLRLV